MSDWLCVKCLHEFPDGPDIKRKPEYVGMVLFLLVGLGCIIFGAVAIFLSSTEYALKGGILILGGLAAIAFSWQLKTGLKAICPECGKPQGIRGDTKSADEIRKKGKPL